MLFGCLGDFARSSWKRRLGQDAEGLQCSRVWTFRWEPKCKEFKGQMILHLNPALPLTNLVSLGKFLIFSSGQMGVENAWLAGERSNMLLSTMPDT